MSNVIKAMRLDYYTLKENYKTFVVAYVLAIFLALLTQPTLTIVIVIIFSSIFSGMAFSVSEKNHLSKLYGSLPLGRSEMVIGRYLYAFLFCFINWIFSAFLAIILSFFVNKGSIDYLYFIFYLSFFYFYFCLYIGISFPIYFKYGFSKAFIFTVLPLYLIGISGVLISRNADSIKILKETIQYFWSNPTMMLVAGIGLGLILLIISCPLSCMIHKKHEL